jgi:hypothetical protein
LSNGRILTHTPSEGAERLANQARIERAILEAFRGNFRNTYLSGPQVPRTRKYSDPSTVLAREHAKASNIALLAIRVRH